MVVEEVEVGGGEGRASPLIQQPSTLTWSGFMVLNQINNKGSANPGLFYNFNAAAATAVNAGL